VDAARCDASRSQPDITQDRSTFVAARRALYAYLTDGMRDANKEQMNPRRFGKDVRSPTSNASSLSG